MSLAARILLLIALAMAPVMVAQVYTQVELQFAREADDRSDAIRYARLVSSDALRVVEGMKGIMTAVRETPFVRAFDEAQCRDYLANLARRYPQIFNITLIDESGQPICANTPSAPNATARDRLYFQEALRTEDFVIGDYIVGRTIPQPQLPVALPFRDDAGRRLVLSIGIDVDWLQRHFHELDLPPGAALWLTDRKGIVVVAPSASSIGFPLPADLQASRTTQEAAFRYQDTNGNPHMVGVVPAVAPPIGLSVVVDLQQQPLSLLAAAEVRRDLIVLAVAILAAIVLATVGTWRLVSRPLQRLTAAARQWTAGAYDVRVNLPDRSSEVGRLGAAFDQMADAIQTNQRALQQANETLEQRVLARTVELSAANRQLEAEMAERQAAEAALR
ncbi:MAG: HAMP domain-containing protein, partial [Proteobacteria bacterium]|nr:HAMP domain-containing protein [Pseudomonadota bacterium]